MCCGVGWMQLTCRFVGLIPKYNVVSLGHLKPYSDSDVGGTAPTDCTCWNTARAISYKSWTFHLGQRSLLCSDYFPLWCNQLVALMTPATRSLPVSTLSLQETLQLLPARGSLLPYLLCLDWPGGLLVNLQWKYQVCHLEKTLSTSQILITTMWTAPDKSAGWWEPSQREHHLSHSNGHSDQP